MAGSKTTIVLTQEDVPTKLQLIHAASRLKKDYELLKKVKGAKNTEDPSSMAVVASFLEMLVKRESRNLRKETEEQELKDVHIQSMLETAVEYLQSLSQEKQKELSDEAPALSESSGTKHEEVGTTILATSTNPES